jgi:hypothetical protein
MPTGKGHRHRIKLFDAHKIYTTVLKRRFYIVAGGNLKMVIAAKIQRSTASILALQRRQEYYRNF